MFNFTTQTVYNSIETTGANKNMYIATGVKPVLRIGNTRFDAEDILDVQVKLPTVESLASVTFDMADILIDSESTDTEITARIALYIGLSMNSQDSLYANAYLYKGKPLYVEFPVKKSDTADVVAKRVKAIADKYFLFMAENKILDVTIDVTDGEAGTVTFTGVNGYQQIKKAALQKFDPEAVAVDCCSNQGAFVDVKVGVPVMFQTDATGAVTSLSKVFDGVTKGGRDLTDDEVEILPGLEAFGDYNWIIHNLRLPTAANTTFWAPTRNEMPVVGQRYTQFIVRICKQRDGIMGEIVGARGTSVTTHVLYVAGLPSGVSPAALVYKAFTDPAPNGLALAISGGAPTQKLFQASDTVAADTVLKDPYAVGD